MSFQRHTETNKSWHKIFVIDWKEIGTWRLSKVSLMMPMVKMLLQSTRSMVNLRIWKNKK